jgi:hypothetical protein
MARTCVHDLPATRRTLFPRDRFIRVQQHPCQRRLRRRLGRCHTLRQVGRLGGIVRRQVQRRPTRSAKGQIRIGRILRRTDKVREQSAPEQVILQVVMG